MKLPVTPLQRWHLRELMYAEAGPKVKGGQEGRRFRRFGRHLGIDVITTAVVAGQGKVSSKQVASQVPALHELDEDDRDRLLALAELERSAVSEDVLGPLFDLCEDWRAGRLAADVEGVEDFDAAAEDWKAPTADEGPDPG